MTIKPWTLVVLALVAFASITYTLGAEAPPPDYTGMARVATDDTPTATVSPLRREAEDGNIQAPMVVAADPQASNGQYVYATVSYAGYDDLEFYVTTEANYEIWGRASADTDGSNSFWVQVDDGPQQATWDIPLGPWTWIPVTHRELAEPPVVQVYHLSVGFHSVAVLGREAGARLDVLELRVATPTPTPTRTPLTTDTATPAATSTASATLTGTPTATQTATPTDTATATTTQTVVTTATPTTTPADTGTVTPTATETATALPTFTPTETPSPTGTLTPVPTATGTATSTATSTPTSLPTPTPTVTPPGDLTLTGRVFNSLLGPGGGIPGATVAVIMCTSHRFEILTDANGDYSHLLSGLYLNECNSVTLEATAPGFGGVSLPIAVSQLRASPVQNFALLPLPTPTRTATASATPTATPSLTATATASTTPTATATPSLTATASPTFTATPSATATPLPTSTPTATETLVPTPTPTATFSPTVTLTPAPTLTPTPSWHRIYLPRVIRIKLPSPTPTLRWTLTPTATPGWTPTPTPSEGWIQIVKESFDGLFPAPGWDRWGSAGYKWGPRDCRAHTGEKSAWCVGDGLSGSLLSCGSNYPTDAGIMLVYGPFSLEGAAAARMSFWTWSFTEYGYDTCFFGASIDGEAFGGTRRSGQLDSWTNLQLEFNNVPNLGNLLGSPQVWVGFYFDSDSSTTAPEGWYIDDVRIDKYVGSPSPPITEAQDRARVPGEPALMYLRRP